MRARIGGAGRRPRVSRARAVGAAVGLAVLGGSGLAAHASMAVDCPVGTWDDPDGCGAPAGDGDPPTLSQIMNGSYPNANYGGWQVGMGAAQNQAPGGLYGYLLQNGATVNLGGGTSVGVGGVPGIDGRTGGVSVIHHFP